MGTHTREFVALVAILAVSGLAAVEDAAAQEAAPLLSGPAVERSTGSTGSGGESEMAGMGEIGQRTIVERSFEGALVELEVHPATAALAKLDLSDAERAATDRVLDERAKYVSKAARENQALILRLQTARRGGGEEGPRELVELMREARPLLEPLVRPSLVEKLSGVLEEKNSAELKRMVGEYMEAYGEVQRERMGEPSGEGAGRGARAAGGRAGGRGAALAESGLALREIARAFATTVEMRREQTEALLRAIDATPEQEGQIQQILRDVGSEDGLGTPSPAKRREIIERIAEVLTPEQRVRLRQSMRGG